MEIQPTIKKKEEVEIALMPDNVWYYKDTHKPVFGKGFDIHKAIRKLPRPKAGYTPSKYTYMGPFNPLHQRLEYDKNTGKVNKWHVQPYYKVDEIAAYHDICYEMGR